MYYATAGQQATQQPPSSRGTIGGYPRGGPPGFSSRSADPNDFPALGSHPSTYASQAQPSAAGSNTIPQQQQQQIYLQQQHQQIGGPPPPPPGIAGPNPNSSANQVPAQTNGPAQDDFPALNSGGGDSKDARLSNYLRNQPNPAQQGTSSPNLPNGITSTQIPPSSTSASQSTNATPSTNPPQVLQNLDNNAAWQHQQQQQQQSNEPLTRPIQQILTSPVDKWGLKALLYEIQMHMNKTDRGMLVFGEELEELGMDISGEEALYPSFVTPWADANSLTQPPRIEESYHIPQCYNVHAPPVSTKLPNFTEDTLFLAFYMSPGDVLQLEVAEELYARGWRYHTDLQTWITSPTLPSIDLVSLQQSSNEGSPQWIRGPFMYLDTRTWTKQRTNEEFTIDANLLEITRPASIIVSEEKSQTHTPSSSGGLVNPTSSNQSQSSQSQGQNQNQAYTR